MVFLAYYKKYVNLEKIRKGKLTEHAQSRVETDTLTAKETKTSNVT
jgi:hypothetical protein